MTDHKIANQISKLLQDVQDAKGSSTKIELANSLFEYLFEQKDFIKKHTRFAKIVGQKTTEFKMSHKIPTHSYLRDTMTKVRMFLKQNNLY